MCNESFYCASAPGRGKSGSLLRGRRIRFAISSFEVLGGYLGLVIGRLYICFGS